MKKYFISTMILFSISLFPSLSIAADINIAPENFNQVPGACGKAGITLSWSNIKNAQSYVLKRDGEVIGANIKGTIFNDTAVVVNSKHTYTIAGKNSKGVGPIATLKNVTATSECSSSWISKPSLMANAIGAMNDETRNLPQVEKNVHVANSVNETSRCMVTKTLSKGMNNEEVKCLQQKLIEKGYNIKGIQAGEETTLFGYNTMMAVKNFQSINGLKADGVFGITSRQTLFR